MYFQLSKREKQKKLTQARKRVILWPAQQQTHNALRKSSSLTKLKSTTTSSSPRKIDQDIHLPPFVNLSFTTSIPLNKDQIKTIQSIQQTFRDLQDQRQVVNISIDVSTRRLEFLQKIKTPQ